ncbi:hypothetical protein B7G54_28730 [Burkholderia puraquae]|uniref:Uncharacterized protein n=1 Tax=Burkholderia puraquae TaxID=1904757 RepID=A0A1X1P9K1_9BURK|nr:hypothetical protein B7G54_28730 [Burkholderia puraquae]
MTYAQFRESGPGSRRGGTFAAQNPYPIVLIDFSQNARERPNGPEGRPERLSGKSGRLFNKVIHMRCG